MLDMATGTGKTRTCIGLTYRLVKARRLQIATIQGMVRRILFPAEDGLPLPVDQYDCIVVDECHRGYSLDRDMTEGELVFRSEKDYISKYTRVLDYFDAVKVGLTATPALHTTAIFGEPVYIYAYRQAVIDGWLIDHAPPVCIKTDMGINGITWEKDEAMDLYNRSTKRFVRNWPGT